MSKVTHLEHQLAAARTDLTLAQQRAERLSAGQVEASRKADVYIAWQADVAVAASEIDRLSALIEVLEGEVAATRDRLAVLRKRETEKQKANAPQAKRFAAEWTKRTAGLLEFVGEIAASALEDQEIIQGLRDLGESPSLISVDYLARAILPQPERILKQEVVSRWCHGGTDQQLGNQVDVIAIDANRGVYITPLEHRVDCERRSFVETTFHPEIFAEWPEPIWTALKLPSADRGGLMWDGSQIASPQAAIAALAGLPLPPRPKERRPVLTRAKVVPIEEVPTDEGPIVESSIFAEAGAELNGTPDESEADREFSERS